MRQAIIAFLLSAFVFPGLGQLYNQNRKKGVILVLLANLLFGVLLLAGMVLFSRGYHEYFYPQPLTWKIIKELLRYLLGHPLFFLPLSLLLGLWGFAALDAGRGARRRAAAAPTEE
jgi:TM2 domain-containing membrane protein YozV